MSPLSRWRRLFFISMIVAAAPTAAQIPDEFTNLRFLSQDVTKDQIVGIMRDWAAGIGASCNYCHVGPDDLVGMDFASDEKATKRTARRMLVLSRAINRELLEDLPTVEANGRTRHLVVSCYTCHRGEARPKNVPPRELYAILP